MWVDYLTYFLLTLLPYLLQKTVVKDVKESDVYSRIGWGVLFLSIVNLTGCPWIFYVLFTLLSLFALVDIFYSITFKAQFSLEAIEATFLTNQSEAVEFVFSYLNLANIAAASFYLAAAFAWLYYFDLINTLSQPGLVIPLQIVAALLAIYLGFLLIKQKRYQCSFPGVIGLIIGFAMHYKTQQKLIALRHLLIDQLPDRQSVKDDQPHAKTIVLVIGEASTRRHYSLYGYGRKTNPCLEQHQDLICFSDAISAFSQTNSSLSHLLTSASSQDDSVPDLKPSIIDVAKKQGYKTFWISNQELTRSLPHSIANSADHYIFCPGAQGLQHDEIVIPNYLDAINDDAKYKFIVIHLMGSHLKYQQRYPKSFHQFIDSQNVQGYKPNLSTLQIKTINEYDNSILYTDYIVDALLAALKSSRQSEDHAFIFSSDHGEEVYQTRNFKGHEPENPSAPMLEVPLIGWLGSNLSKARALLDKHKDQPVLLDDVFYLLAHLMGSAVLNDASHKSLASKDYKLEQRKAYGRPYIKKANN